MNDSPMYSTDGHSFEFESLDDAMKNIFYHFETAAEEIYEVWIDGNEYSLMVEVQHGESYQRVNNA